MAQANDDENSEYMTAHATPAFNLAIEPWIPVTLPDGTTKTVALRDLLINAHTYRDVSVSEPFTQTGLYRFLIALTAALIRDTAGDTPPRPSTWETRYLDNTGFTATEVDHFLDSVHDHLYLYHPTYPFLQHAALATAQKDTKTEKNVGGPLDSISIDQLKPAVPGDSTATWFQFPGDPGFRDGMTPADAALGLIYRRFYVLPGNGGGGDSGGTFSEVIATLTHVFRITGTSVFTTLLRNLTPGLMRAGEPGQPDGLAWLTGIDPHPHGTDLYQASLSVTNVLLNAPTDNGHIYDLRMKRTLDKLASKAIRAEAKEKDHHVIFIEQRRTHDNPTDESTETKSVRLTPSRHRMEVLAKLLSDDLFALADQAPYGIIRTSNLWLPEVDPDPNEAFYLLLAEKVGGALSPKYKDAVTLYVPHEFVEPTGNDQLIDDLRYLMSTLIGGPRSQKRRLEKALGTATNPDNGGYTPLALKATPEWLNAVATHVDEFVAGRVTRDEVTANMNTITVELFDRYTTAVTVDPRYAESTAKARSTLRSKHD